MKFFLSILFLISANFIVAQSLAKIPDSIRKVVVNENYGVKQNNANQSSSNYNEIDKEEQVKTNLIKLAFKNAGLAIADANIEIAEIGRKRAKSSILNAVRIDGNVNEFVINGSTSAAFYPKYNLGLSLPLDIFAKNKAEKENANQMILISKFQKIQLEANIKSKVLSQYETYKEKKALVDLQKIAMDDNLAAYERAQIEYKDNNITLEELNDIYKVTIMEKAILVTKEKELRIAIIEIEELIGIPLQKVLQ